MRFTEIHWCTCMKTPSNSRRKVSWGISCLQVTGRELTWSKRDSNETRNSPQQRFAAPIMSSNSSSGGSSPKMITHQVSEVVESNITLLDLFREGASEVSFGIRKHCGRSQSDLLFPAEGASRSTCTSSLSHESRENLPLPEESTKLTNQ